MQLGEFFKWEDTKMQLGGFLSRRILGGTSNWERIQVGGGGSILKWEKYSEVTGKIFKVEGYS